MWVSRCTCCLTLPFSWGPGFTPPILLGIDKFMSECRALTNLVGNGVATIVISRWEGELNAAKLHEAMAHPIDIGAIVERESVEAARS